MTHYDNAPITEAIIELQFAGPAVSHEELATLQDRESMHYPEKKSIFFATFKIGDPQQQPGEVPEVTKGVPTQMGWAFVTADRLQVWQIRNGAFTFSRLAPYQSWQPFVAEARRLWAVTRTVVKPETITRVAVRYINRLQLPLPFADFKDYLQTVPEVSPILPQGLAAFFMQLHIPQPDIEAMLVLNEQLLPDLPQDLPPKVANILLDIDLSKQANLPQNEEGLWSLIEQLHSKKNEIFEACITDRTRDLIK